MRHLFRKKKLEHILAEIRQNEADGHALSKNLHLRDLISFGIAAIVGAGIFSTIGTASFNGGPAVIFLFIFTAFACLFSALCYAEFASTIPISGSAYSYAYVTFGELIAWILGWSLVMEYAIGNIAVAISWSDYLTGMLTGLGVEFPLYLTMDYLTAMRSEAQVAALMAKGQSYSDMPEALQQSFQAWQTAPSFGGNLRVVLDLPALFITILVTSLIYVGIKESKQASNAMVVLKLLVVLLVISVGFFYVNPSNWSPFAPNGVAGVLKGVSAVFFAYIGFDAISTTAEECRNPQKDLPRAMIGALIICTILYILITLVLTGMVSYKELKVGDPLAFVFKKNGNDMMEGIISVSAVIAITGVFLVFQLGQPRILMTMSRDGLLPKAFSKIHPRFQTPYIATIATGFLVAIPALFMNLTEVTDLTSIGTLFAFMLVSAGVLLMEESANQQVAGRFRVPYVNSQWIVPALLVAIVVAVYVLNAEGITHFFSLGSGKESLIEALYHRFPMIVFMLVCVWMSYACFRHKLSLIPVLGVLTNLYLITELGTHNWIGFAVWMSLGLVIYFSYGVKHSKLASRKQAKS